MLNGPASNGVSIRHHPSRYRPKAIPVVDSGWIVFVDHPATANENARECEDGGYQS